MVKENPKNTFLIIVVILILAGGGVGIYFYLKNKKEKDALLVRAKAVSTYLPSGITPDKATEIQVKAAEDDKAVAIKKVAADKAAADKAAADKAAAEDKAKAEAEAESKEWYTPYTQKSTDCFGNKITDQTGSWKDSW